MAEIIPFKGILYNPLKVDASAAVAPPYDIVTHDGKNELYEKSPYNIIRIDFGKDSDGDNEGVNRYTRASEYLSDWLEQGVLIKDPGPYFYCYEIEYMIDGMAKKTRGFFCAVRLEEIGEGSIRPHEMTYSKPKTDRLNILRFCNANTSPIFSLYSSQERTASSLLEEIVRERPFIEAGTGDGSVHRLWKITDRDSIEKIQKEMAGRDIFIADGHHRYETSLAFRKEMQEKGLCRTGTEPFNYVLMFLSNMEEEGLSLLPTHRIVEVDSDLRIKEVLGKYFDIQKINSAELSGKQAMQKMFGMMKKSVHTFGMYLTNADTYYVLSFNAPQLNVDLPECLRGLDVSVLHKVIFEDLLKIEHYEYEMDPDVAVDRANKGSFEAVFFLNPTRIHDVKEVASAGFRMPPKSTYFFPKLLTGMVMYCFD